MKTYYFTVARGATRAADASLLQGIRRFEDEIAWLIEEDNFAHSVRKEEEKGRDMGRRRRGCRDRRGCRTQMQRCKCSEGATRGIDRVGEEVGVSFFRRMCGEAV